MSFGHKNNFQRKYTITIPQSTISLYCVSPF